MSPSAKEAPRFSSYSFPGSFEPHPYFPGLLQMEARIAPATGDALKQRGADLHLLSGDHSEHAQQVADQLGIPHCRSGASPEDKLAFVTQLQNSGKVLMIGDGLNDAPVLAAANVSVALASGSDLAKISADSLILNNRLSTLQRALDIAVFNRSIMRQNITWAVVYNTLAVPFAAFGFVPPWAAAIGMSASSLVVVLNALRTRRQARKIAARYS